MRKLGMADLRWLAEFTIGPAKGRTRWLAPQGDGESESFSETVGMIAVRLQTGPAAR